MLFILDRLIILTVTFAIAFAVIFPFRRWLNKHTFIQNVTLLFIANVLFMYSPKILFKAAAEGKENLSFDEHRHVDSFSYGDAFFSISAYDYVMTDSDHVFTNSQIVMYEPWLVGYYASDQEGIDLTLIYDDGAGTRELIHFFGFRLEDGSQLVIIEHNLADDLETLVIEGQTMSFTAIGTSKYLYFIMTPEFVFVTYRTSIVYNGVEIGDRFPD
ncbi:MAG TPA: hypothetical protein DCR44_03045 [Acholeplasmatales bacterium]|nr:MAG: hypothetical protein A2Y16_03375 [Tenericutes bacterium GWF2_57_13]HAQ56369.1 hypothetical protein [Acholeplasmatales bacterium]